MVFGLLHHVFFAVAISHSATGTFWQGSQWISLEQTSCIAEPALNDLGFVLSATANDLLQTLAEHHWQSVDICDNWELLNAPWMTACAPDLVLTQVQTSPWQPLVLRLWQLQAMDRGVPIWVASITNELSGVSQPAALGYQFRELLDANHQRLQPLPWLTLHHAPRSALTTESLPTRADPALWEHYINSSTKGPLNAAIVERVPTRNNLVALTFDACGGPADIGDYDALVIEQLRNKQAHATLFIGGRWAEAYEPVVRQLALDPLFEIGNHAFSHAHLTRISEAQVHAELVKTQDILYGITGDLPKFFRPPYGEVNSNVANVAAKVGLCTVQYDLPAGDPDPAISKDRLIAWVLQNAHAGSIVVMHMNHPKFVTAAALPEIIDGLRKKGLQPATLSELLAQGNEAMCP